MTDYDDRETASLLTAESLNTGLPLDWVYLISRLVDSPM